MQSRTRTAAAILVVALAVAGGGGCASTKQAVKATIEQGIEPTSTGPHNTGLGNAAQNAVDKANAAQQQLEQGVPSPE